MPESNSFRFHCFPSKLSVCRKKKESQIQRHISDLHLSFYKSTELNCAFSHTSINQNECTGFKGPPSNLSLCDWQQDVLSFLPPIAVELPVIAIKWDNICLHSSLCLTFQLLRSLLIKEILIFMQLITLERWPNTLICILNFTWNESRFAL